MTVVSSDDRPYSGIESEVSDVSCSLPPEDSLSPPAATGISLPAEGSSASLCPSPLDIGVLLKNGTLHSLDKTMKLKLIKQTPDAKFTYPTKYMHGCNQCFKPEWVQSHSWLHYSVSKNGPTDIKQQKLGSLVNKPFSLWTRQSSIFTSHEQLAYHQDSMTKMSASKSPVLTQCAMLLPCSTKHTKSKYLKMHR